LSKLRDIVDGRRAPASLIEFVRQLDMHQRACTMPDLDAVVNTEAR